MEVIPHATVFQQSIDLDDWPIAAPPKRTASNGPVVIGHVSSKRIYKGTQYVIDAVDQLQREGLAVELDLIENITHDAVRQRVKECDIGVDEVIQGSYGNVAIEMMAIGRPVVARLCDWYESEREDLPVVNAEPGTLTDALRRLVTDVEYRLRLGDEGRKYVARYHNVNQHVAELETLYRSVLSPTK
jgi:glycosyltransferase involved in cell wall biosynthesis